MWVEKEKGRRRRLKRALEQLRDNSRRPGKKPIEKKAPEKTQKRGGGPIACVVTYK